MKESGNGETNADINEHSILEHQTADVINLGSWAQMSSRRRHPSRVATETRATPLTDHSPDALWRADFEVHADQYTEVTTSGMWVLAPVVERALRRSLPVFQLGKTGAGFHLLHSARGVVSDDLERALRLFVLEEQEQARVHAVICAALDIATLDEHWSDRAFRAARRIRGFRAEMLLMGVAELITAEVYRVLSMGVGDPTLSRLFARMYTDEQRHLDFHASVLPPHLERLPRVVRTATQRVWLVSARFAIVAVAVEHRSLFRACGTGVRAFIGSATAASQTYRSRLFST